MNGPLRQASGLSRMLAPALLVTLALAAASGASCLFTRPERDLWIEIVSCSDGALKEVSDELFLQALTRTDADYTRDAAARAAALLRETPGFLVYGRELAFADTSGVFYAREPNGKSVTRFSDRPGEWQSSGDKPERRYFLGSLEPTCEAVSRSGRVVAREIFRCCDTGRGPELGCILEVRELAPSLKAPPTAEEISAASVAAADSPAATEAPAGAPGPF